LEKIQYLFRYYSEARKHFFETTLLDNLQLCPGNDYGNMWQGSTIVLAPHYTSPISMYHEYKALETVAATPQLQARDSSREFQNFIFHGKGEPLRKPDDDGQADSTGSSSKQPQSGAGVSDNQEPSTGATSQSIQAQQEVPAAVEWFTDSDRVIDFKMVNGENLNPAGVVLAKGNDKGSRKSS
jgi:hypothetical protein